MKISSAPVLAALLSLMSALSQAAPTINTSPSSATPIYGGSITLSASVTAEPGATYAWTRGSTAIINGGRYSGATTATLVITGANIGDDGSYTLTVTDGTGSSATTPATVTVTQNGTDRDPATTSIGSNSSVTSILHLPDGRTLVGGNLTGAASTSTSSRLSIVQTNYQVASTPVGTFDGSPSRLILQPDGKILVLGPFTTIGGTSGAGRTYLARLNADLTLDTSFVPPIPNAGTTSAVLDDQGRIYLGGAFTQLGGRPEVNYFARLLPNGSLDTTFSIPVNSTVKDLVIQADGKIIVGGTFTTYGPTGNTTAVQGLIRLLSTGAYDSSFTAAFAPANTLGTGITDLAFDSQQRLLVAAYHLGAAVPYGVFRLLSSGANDANFNFTETLNNFPSVIEPVAGDKVLVGGGFTTAINSYFRLNSDGSRDTAFTTSLGTGFGASSASLLALAHDAYGRLWIGGGFTTYKSTTVNRLLVVQGEQPTSLAFVSQPLNSSAALTSTATLTAAATGNNGFTFQWLKNGNPLSDGGRISGATTGTLSISAVVAGDEANYSVVVSSPGATSVTSRVANLDVLGAPEITQEPVALTVEFGGTATFTGAATGATTLTYQWYYGTTALTNGTGVSGATSATLTLTNVDFADAGQYSLKVTNGLGDDTTASAQLTVQKRPGGIAASANPLPMFNGEVHAIALLPDGSYVVGGGFDSVSMNGGLNFNSRSCLMRVLANGTLDTSFPTAAGAVHAVEVDSAGKIFIGGGFSSVTANSVQTNRVRVARLIASGSSYVLDSAFDTSTVGPNQNVFAIAPVGDGSAFIGGDFTQIGTTTAGVNKMARLNANGTVNTAFVSGANNTVHKLWRRTDGSLYVAGLSSRWGVAEFAPRGVILVSANGARIAAFVPPGTGTSYFPGGHALLQLADGSLLAGLNWAGGNPYAVRMDGAKGTLDAFNSTHGTTVTALAQQSDGKVLIGGSFGYFTRNSPTDGTVDTTMNVGAGFVGAGITPKINAIKVDSNGRIFVGGNFTHYDGSTRNRFVILNGGDLDSRTEPKPGQTITFADIADRAFVPANATANAVTITLPTSSSNLPVSLVVTSGPATLLGNKLTFTGAGTVVLTASQAGNDNFSAASVSQTIEVSKAAQTITFERLIDRPTGTVPFLLSGSASSGLPISYQVLGGPATVSGNVLTLTGGTGVVTLRASQAGNADFTAAADVEQSFDVVPGTPAKLSQTILFNPLPGRSVSQPLTFALNASSSSGLPLTYTFTGPVTSIVNGIVTLSGATGTIAITAKQAGDANFLPAADVKQSFAVTAAATSLTLTNLVQTYDGTPKSIGVVGGSADTIFYTVNKVKGTTPPTAAGSYPVEAVSGTGASAIKKAGTLVINKAPLLVVADDKRKFIGQINPPLTFAYSGFLGSDNAGNALSKAPAVTTTATTTSTGGNYPIKPAGGTAANYNLIYVNGNMKIESWAGQYETLLTDATNGPTAKVEFTVSAGSRDLTGKITTSKSATVVSFKGPLGLDFGSEYAMADINATVGTGAAAVIYNVRIDIPLNSDFSATVTRQENSVTTTLGTIASGRKLQLYNGTPPVTYAGTYTLIFAPDTTANVLPKPTGSGFATAAIDAKGKMTFVGALPDGTKITTSLLPDAEAGYRLYLTPYTGRLNSYCAGWFEPDEHPDLALAGRGIITPGDNLFLYWAKAAPVPATKDTNYRGGIPESKCAITMDPWLPPTTKAPIFTVPQRLVLNTTGDIEPLFETAVSSLTPNIPTLLRMDSKGAVSVNLPAVTPANPSGYKITVTPATGAFTGSFNLTDGSTKRLVNFSGVMRQTPLSETTGAVIGAGFGIVPQLTGQSAGTTGTSISFERP